MQDMEDVGGCEEALLGAAQPAVLCSIFDGHCGRGAADEALTALPAALAERLPAASAGLADGSGAAAAWQEAFQEADRGLRSEEGCTATAILAWLDAQGSVCLQVTPPFPHCCHKRGCSGLFPQHVYSVHVLGCGMVVRDDGVCRRPTLATLRPTLRACPCGGAALQTSCS